MSVNSIVLAGRLTRDPELAFTKGGTSYCRFTLAVDRYFKKEGKADADFFRVVVFGKQAESAAQYLSKGGWAGVSGRIEMDEYTDKDGNNRLGVSVHANDVRFLGGGKQEQSHSTQDEGSQEVSDDSFGDDDELPF